MSDLLDSDGPDYDPDAFVEGVDRERKAARERGEKIGPDTPPAPESKRCSASFGRTFRARCILEDGHKGGHHYRTS